MSIKRRWVGFWLSLKEATLSWMIGPREPADDGWTERARMVSDATRDAIAAWLDEKARRASSGSYADRFTGFSALAAEVRADRWKRLSDRDPS